MGEQGVYLFLRRRRAVQCGFCIPGMIMCTKALLDKNLDPTEEIRYALRNNYCRCTGYVKIVAAVKLAAKIMETVRKMAQTTGKWVPVFTGFNVGEGSGIWKISG